MNILWVKVGGLWPLHMGGRLRSYHTVAELSRRNRVTVLTTHGPGEDGTALATELPRCEVVSFPWASPKAGTAEFARVLARSWMSSLPVDLLKWRVPQLQAEVSRRLSAGDVDLCVADFLFAIPNIGFGRTPVVLFEHNVEHMIWKRLADVETRSWRRALLEIEWRKVRRSERDACTRARMVIAVSPVDRDCLAANAPTARTRSIATGVDTKFYTANGTPEKPAHLVFTGAMDWYPNEEAMLFFLGEVLPSIRRAMPEVTMTIVGKNPSQRLRTAGEASNVQVTGTVDDVRPFIDEGAVYVVPIRIGGGTRLKIFEALSMGKAVVSTAVGAEGLPVVDGEHFVRADRADEFATAVLALLRDTERRKTIGRAGQQLVRAQYSWETVGREFESVCAEVVA